MYLCLVTANVDFLSREYTLYYKVGMGDKEDRRVECIFVEWRVFIDDMLSGLFLLFSRSVVYRVDYGAPSATVNFGGTERGSPRRERKIDLFP